MASELRQQLIDILKKAVNERAEEFVLSSGARSRHFLDGKEALGDWPDLELASRAIVEALRDQRIDFDAVGGLTLGADALAIGIASVARCKWFFVRKEPKNRGTNRVIEGYQISAADRVVLVDDAVTSGSSILQAHDAVVAAGARVVAAVTLADRSGVAAAKFAALGVPYIPMATYADLEIPPVDLT